MIGITKNRYNGARYKSQAGGSRRVPKHACTSTGKINTDPNNPKANSKVRILLAARLRFFRRLSWIIGISNGKLTP